MTLNLTVPTIVCSGCADTVTKAVKDLDATASVTIDLASKAVTIETYATETAVREAIATTGHTVA